MAAGISSVHCLASFVATGGRLRPTSPADELAVALVAGGLLPFDAAVTAGNGGLFFAQGVWSFFSRFVVAEIVDHGSPSHSQSLRGDDLGRCPGRPEIQMPSVCARTMSDLVEVEGDLDCPSTS